MYQYIQVLIYVFFRKEIKWGQVPYNLRELLNKYLRWSRSQAKVTAPAPSNTPASGSSGSETLIPAFSFIWLDIVYVNAYRLLHVSN